jgi:hypothetical protein
MGRIIFAARASHAEAFGGGGKADTTDTWKAL